MSSPIFSLTRSFVFEAQGPPFRAGRTRSRIFNRLRPIVSCYHVGVFSFPATPLCALSRTSVLSASSFLLPVFNPSLGACSKYPGLPVFPLDPKYSKGSPFVELPMVLGFSSGEATVWSTSPSSICDVFFFGFCAPSLVFLRHMLPRRVGFSFGRFKPSLIASASPPPGDQVPSFFLFFWIDPLSGAVLTPFRPFTWRLSASFPSGSLPAVPLLYIVTSFFS